VSAGSPAVITAGAAGSVAATPVDILPALKGEDSPKGIVTATRPTTRTQADDRDAEDETDGDEADDSDAGMNETDDESGPDAAENDLPAERDLRGHLYDEDNLRV
jgi:hypothetical protein